MKVNRYVLVFAGLSFALWLALSTPGLDFMRRAWIPLAGWFVLGLLAVRPAEMSRRAGAHPATYGMVAISWGGLVTGLGAVLAAAALLVARYTTVTGMGWDRWATSPVLGALFVLVFIAAVVPLMAMTNRDLGEDGTRPIEEQRESVRSHAAPTKNAGAGGFPVDPKRDR